jgi:hypothetical protein
VGIAAAHSWPFQAVSGSGEVAEWLKAPWNYPERTPTAMKLCRKTGQPISWTARGNVF